MKNWPLRLKVTLWAVLVGGVALLLFGTVLGIRVHLKGLAHLDSTLSNETEVFFQSLKELEEPMQWENDNQIRQLFGLVGSLYVFQVEQPPGKYVFRSRNLGPTRTLPAGQDGVPFNASFGNDELRIMQSTRDGVRVAIAADLGPIEHVEDTLWISFATLFPITLILIAAGGTWLSRKALSPVEEITAAAERITAERSGQKLPIPAARDEIGHLTEVLNAMIERIQQSYEQARRFSADASHELKTPLTIIRGEIEAALRSITLPSSHERVMLNLQEETGRLVHIVEGLLLLSQADAGKLKLDLRPIDIRVMLHDLLEDVEILSSPRGITLEVDMPDAAIVNAEPQFVRQILLNLFDNAIKYNEPNGKIRAELKVDKDWAIFTISNTGAKIPAEDRDRVFDRFHRSERSRDRARGGQGLGLSICREIARSHGGDISYISGPDENACFQLRLPRVILDSSGIATAMEAGRLS